MRLTISLVLAFLTAGIAACSSSTIGTGNGPTSDGPTSDGTSAIRGSGLAGDGAQHGTGTCDAACAHYLECKAADSTENRAVCNQDCATLGLTAEQLTAFQSTDCTTAIATIEGQQSGTATSTSTNNGGGGTDCNGCAWDGSSCIYLTGSGGNYFACERSCCP